MKEIRLSGRGGQGVAVAAQILGAAFVASGQYASSFPMFGVERRGAPVVSFLRFDDKPIREKTKIYSPDCMLIFDVSQMNSPAIFEGAKPGSIVILNTDGPLDKKPHKNVTLLAALNATKIAIEEIGIPVINTCMLGAFASATDWLSLDHIIAVLEEFFKEKSLETNIKSCRRGFQEAQVVTWP